MNTSRLRIGVREVKELGQKQTIWDSRVPGFCARRRGTEAVVYGVKYRTKEGRQRWQTIGRHGAPWTPETARDEARRILSEVAKGNDPAGQKHSKRRAATVAHLCDDYLAAADQGRLLTRRGQNKKESTLQTDRSRIEAHIKPLLGQRKAAEIDRHDIEKFLHDVAAGKTKRLSHLGKPRAVSHVRGGRGAATRTVGLLGAIFSYAVRIGVCTGNPVRGIVRFADGQRNRRLSDGEYKQLCCGAASAKGIWPYAVHATKFLALTGWRSGEALKLRWRDLDLDRHVARLPDTKTGASTRLLPRCVLLELDKFPRGNSDDLVFPSTTAGTAMSGFPSMFRKIVRAGGLAKDVTPHVLRHSYASVAADLGFSELTIAALIGHRGSSITSRYTHHADSVLLAASNRVASRISELMDGRDETQRDKDNVLVLPQRGVA